MKYLLSLFTLLFFTVMLAAQSSPISIGVDVGWKETNYRFSNNESSGLSLGANFHLGFADRWWFETGINFYAGKGDRPLDEGLLLSINLRQQRISVPLRFGYEIVNRDHITLAAFGGVYVGNERLKAIYYLNQFDFDASDAEFQNGFGYGATAGIRLSYRLGKVSCYLQPEYLYGYINSGDEHDSFDALFFQRRQHSFGIKLGLLVSI